MINNRAIEKYYPFVLPLIFSILYYVYSGKASENLIIKKLPEWLNITLTLSGISLGFLGTMIGAILSVVNSKIMGFIYAQRADTLLISYIRHAAISNLLVLLLSVVLLITSNDPQEPPEYYLLYPWLYFFCSSFLCSFRIISLLFGLLESINNENRPNQREVYKPDKERLHPPRED